MIEYSLYETNCSLLGNYEPWGYEDEPQGWNNKYPLRSMKLALASQFLGIQLLPDERYLDFVDIDIVELFEYFKPSLIQLESIYEITLINWNYYV